MKRITITLSDKAEKAFNEIMYSLPKNEDGTGLCTQSQAINYALECISLFEEKMDQDIITFLTDCPVKIGVDILNCEPYPYLNKIH